MSSSSGSGSDGQPVLFEWIDGEETHNRLCSNRLQQVPSEHDTVETPPCPVCTEWIETRSTACRVCGEFDAEGNYIGPIGVATGSDRLPHTLNFALDGDITGDVATPYLELPLPAVGSHGSVATLHVWQPILAEIASSGRLKSAGAFRGDYIKATERGWTSQTGASPEDIEEYLTTNGDNSCEWNTGRVFTMFEYHAHPTGILFDKISNSWGPIPDCSEWVEEGTFNTSSMFPNTHQAFPDASLMPECGYTRFTDRTVGRGYLTALDHVIVSGETGRVRSTPASHAWSQEASDILLGSPVLEGSKLAAAKRMCVSVDLMVGTAVGLPEPFGGTYAAVAWLVGEDIPEPMGEPDSSYEYASGKYFHWFATSPGPGPYPTGHYTAANYCYDDWYRTSHRQQNYIEYGYRWNLKKVTGANGPDKGGTGLLLTLSVFGLGGSVMSQLHITKASFPDIPNLATFKTTSSTQYCFRTIWDARPSGVTGPCPFGTGLNGFSTGVTVSEGAYVECVYANPYISPPFNEYTYTATPFATSVLEPTAGYTYPESGCCNSLKVGTWWTDVSLAWPNGRFAAIYTRTPAVYSGGIEFWNTDWYTANPLDPAVDLWAVLSEVPSYDPLTASEVITYNLWRGRVESDVASGLAVWRTRESIDDCERRQWTLELVQSAGDREWPSAVPRDAFPSSGSIWY